MVSKTESWLSFYKDAVATEVHTKQGKYPAFYQKDPSTSLVLDLYAQIFHSTMVIIADTVANNLDNVQKSAKPTQFFIGQKTLIDTVNACAAQLLKNAQDEESKTSKDSHKKGSKETLKKNMNAAKAIAVKFFETSCPKVSFSSDLTDEAFTAWSERFTIQATNYAYQSLELTKCAAVEFTKDDFQEFSIDPKEVTANPHYINGAAFALLCIREQQATKQIFEEQRNDSLINNFFVHLNSWGYKPTKKPKLQDLAVYVDEADKPEHVGVVEELHKIHSKFGLNPSSHLHKLFDLPASCGQKVIFFTKTGKAT